MNVCIRVIAFVCVYEFLSMCLMMILLTNLRYVLLASSHLKKISFTVYHNDVVTNAPVDSKILSRRYDILFDCSDISIHDNKHISIISCCLTELLSY